MDNEAEKRANMAVANSLFGSLMIQATIDLLAGRGIISGNDAIAIFNRTAIMAESLGTKDGEAVASQARQLSVIYEKRKKPK